MFIVLYLKVVVYRFVLKSEVVFPESEAVARQGKAERDDEHDGDDAGDRAAALEDEIGYAYRGEDS